MPIVKITPTHNVEWIKEKVIYNPKATCFFEIKESPVIADNEVLYFNPKKQTFYTKDKEASLKEEKLYYAKLRKKNALAWLVDNDWKVNKHSLGEWTDEDPRWRSYLKIRKIMRNQIDEANMVIQEL
jgi:hypothetical protein